MEDYKDIHENQKFQTKLNFFENSVDSTIQKKSEKNFHHNVVNSYKKGEKNDLEGIGINVNSNFKSNPHFRKPRDISNNNIERLNNVYDKYKMKIDSKNNEKEKNQDICKENIKGVFSSKEKNGKFF